MIQAAATFGAGIAAGQTFNACKENIPSCAIRGHTEQSVAFKVSVHVHSASASGLNEPGIIAKLQPRLEVLLGDARKESEVADFFGADAFESTASQTPRKTGTSASLGEAAIDKCPWRFGDTLTFSAQLCDIVGVGLKLRLSARRDVSLGPLQLQMPKNHELGEAILNLRRQILPASEAVGCQGASFGGSGHPEWRTPLLVMPLTRLGETTVGVVGQVVVSVSVNVDPETLLKAANDLDAPLVNKMVRPLMQCMQVEVDCAQVSVGCLPLCNATCAQGSSTDNALASSLTASKMQRRLFCDNERTPDADPSQSLESVASYKNCEEPMSVSPLVELKPTPAAVAPVLAGFTPSYPSVPPRHACQTTPLRALEERTWRPATPRMSHETRSASAGHTIASFADARQERLCTSGLRVGWNSSAYGQVGVSSWVPPANSQWHGHGVMQRGAESDRHPPVLKSPVRYCTGANLNPYVGQRDFRSQLLSGYAC